MLAGILDPTAGDAWVAGRHTVREAEALKEDIGYMSQRFGLYPDLTVWENLEFYADIYGVSRRDRAGTMERLLAFSHLTPFSKRLAGNLSGGMKQKLGLACALVHTPKVLLLDEPTNGVDPVSRRDFWRILYQLLRGNVTIVVTTAYLDEAERCGRLALMHRGRLIAVGTPDEVKRTMRGAVLREALPECSVALFGDRVHLTAPSSPAVQQRARDVLAAHHLHVIDLRPVEPSLEDVFIAVLGQAERPHHGRTD